MTIRTSSRIRRILENADLSDDQIARLIDDVEWNWDCSIPLAQVLAELADAEHMNRETDERRKR